MLSLECTANAEESKYVNVKSKKKKVINELARFQVPLPFFFFYDNIVCVPPVPKTKGKKKKRTYFCVRKSQPSVSGKPARKHKPKCARFM